MPNLHYALTNTEELSNTEKLLYISSSHYDRDWKSMYHAHSFTELFYVMDGKGLFCTDEGQFPIEKDQLILINPNVRHTETSSAEHPLNYIVLGIDNLQYQFKEHHTILDCKQYKTLLRALLREMLHELDEKKGSYELICHHYLSILTLKITQITGYTFSTIAPTTTPYECEKTKHYLDTHYQDTITLEQLARMVHRDKYYFAHMFTKSYGISPINYLLERRILHSKELLKHTTLSVTQIAQSTGFSSQNYFSQMFKKSTGATPLQYRKHHSK